MKHPNKGAFCMDKLFLLLKKENRMHASSLAFYMLQCIIPSIILVLLFLNLFNIPSTSLIRIINVLLPSIPSQVINEFIYNSNDRFFSIVILFLSINIVARGIRVLSFSVNYLYKFNQTKIVFSFIKSYVISVVFLFLISLFITILFLLPNKIYFTYPLSMIFLFLLILILFYFLPSSKLKFNDIYPGAFFISFSISLFISLFSVFNNKFLRMSTLYGSMSWIMILLFLLHIFAYIIQIGILINVYYFYKRKNIIIENDRY